VWPWGFLGGWRRSFRPSSGAITLALVFVIQHTQAREQVVTRGKHEEILRALPQADNTLVGLEEATDDELAVVHSDHRELRAVALDG
jgi:low affinity Fe/Cu permease